MGIPFKCKVVALGAGNNGFQVAANGGTCWMPYTVLTYMSPSEIRVGTELSLCIEDNFTGVPIPCISKVHPVGKGVC